MQISRKKDDFITITTIIKINREPVSYIGKYYNIYKEYFTKTKK